MTTHFYHRYNDLDDIHEFGIVPGGELDIYHVWVFFYLGVYLNELGLTKDQFWMFPYKVYSWEKPEKTYVVNGADKVAKLIVNRIKKYIN